MIEQQLALSLPERFTYNFSQQYPSTNNKTGNEITQMYQVEVFILFKHQILATNLLGNVQQLEGRINIQILGVKGLTGL